MTVVYRVVPEGLLQGTQAFFVEVREDLDTEDILQAIMKIQSQRKTYPGCKLVYLRGIFSPQNQDTIYSLCKALVDAGYFIAATSDGKVFYPWITFLKINSVETYENWLGFKVQEFVWHLNNETNPVLPPEPQNTQLFVKSSDPTLLLNFLQTSPFWWRVLGDHVPYVEL